MTTYKHLRVQQPTNSSSQPWFFTLALCWRATHILGFIPYVQDPPGELAQNIWRDTPTFWDYDLMQSHCLGTVSQKNESHVSRRQNLLSSRPSTTELISKEIRMNSSLTAFKPIVQLISLTWPSLNNQPLSVAMCREKQQSMFIYWRIYKDFTYYSSSHGKNT